jgi:hypothetical protein
LRGAARIAVPSGLICKYLKNLQKIQLSPTIGLLSLQRLRDESAAQHAFATGSWDRAANFPPARHPFKYGAACGCRTAAAANGVLRRDLPACTIMQTLPGHPRRLRLARS